MNRGKTCHAVAWHELTMPPLPLALSTVHHLANQLPHTPLIVLDTSLDKMVHQTHQKRDAQTRPERARARQSVHWHAPERARPRRRPDASVDPCPGFQRQTLHDATVSRPDTAIGPRERRAPRPRRRRPPRYCRLSSCARPLLCIVFTEITRGVISSASPTRVRHRQPITAAVAPSSMVRSSVRHGHLALL
jgi:hypothetical protein